MTRRILLVALVGLFAVAGVALADTIKGTGGSDSPHRHARRRHDLRVRRQRHRGRARRQRHGLRRCGERRRRGRRRRRTPFSGGEGSDDPPRRRRQRHAPRPPWQRRGRGWPRQRHPLGRPPAPTANSGARATTRCTRSPGITASTSSTAARATNTLYENAKEHDQYVNCENVIKQTPFRGPVQRGRRLTTRFLRTRATEARASGPHPFPARPTPPIPPNRLVVHLTSVARL